MKQIIILAFWVNGFLSCGQISQEKKVIDEPAVYELISYILTTKEPVDFTTCDKIAETTIGNFTIANEDTLNVQSIDTLFTKEDKEYLLEQFNQASSFRIKKDSLNSKTIIPWDTFQALRKKDENARDFWTHYESKYGAGCFCSIDLPMFSKDKLTAIVTISRNCGSLNGYGGTYIYRKTKGKWIMVKALNTWIS